MQDQVANEIAHEIRNWTPEERQEAASAIAELEQTQGWRLVCGLIGDVRKRKLSELVADSKGREAQEYARALGEIKGLQIVEACTDLLRSKGEEANKELEQRLAGAAA